MKVPTLYIFSGLPGSGKSTLAKLLSQKISAMYVRIDTIEQGLRDLCNFDVEGEGYQWQNVAQSQNADFVNIEICCSDSIEHENRVNTRTAEVENLKLPQWQDVQNRYYEPWETDVIRIDTAGETIQTSFSELLNKLNL